MSHRVVLVPRWGGTPAHDYYPWLARELGALGVELDALELPEPGTPTLERWVPAVREAIERAAQARAGRLVLVGHSVGCQALLHALAGLEGQQADAALLVAGWWTVDEPWPSIRPWIDAPLDHARARGAVGRYEVLLSDDDPFTRDAGATGGLFEERLGAEVRVVPGARHFNGAEEPAVLHALRGLLAIAQG